MRPWRIYYADGSTYSWTHPIENAPCDGVMVIRQDDSDPADRPYTTGIDTLQAKDFYWWDRDRWLAGDRYGLEDYLRRPGWKKILAGRTVPDAVFQRIKARAEVEPL